MSSTWCFSVESDAQPGALPRLVEVFAVHGLVPTRLDATLGEEDELLVDVQVKGVDPQTAAAIARRLERVVSVSSVLATPRS
jgi:acetolactate synthase small subunit